MKTITIIGGGLGGLTAGALLAKAGHRVTLLEQHSVVGGCATTFKRKGGFRCEVGLHKMDGVYTNPTIQRIFTELGVYDAVEFVSSESFYTLTTRTRSYTLPYGIETAKTYLIDIFPDEAEGITRYFDLIVRIGSQIDTLVDAKWYHYALFPFLFYPMIRHARHTVTDVLDRLIHDEELKLVLNANVQYYNDRPDTLSFLYHAKAQSSYYQGKGWFVKGGSQKLSDHLARVITDHGGTVLTGAEATACTTEEVTYTHHKEHHTLPADLIISNLSPQDTYRLFGHPYEESRAISEGLVTVYLGFSKNLREVYGARSYANFFMDDLQTVHEYEQALESGVLERSFGFTDYAQIDADLTKDPGKSFAVTCTTDYIREWDTLNEAAYRENKELLIQNTLQRLEQHYPGITDLVEYTEAGTAKTQQRYLKTPKGTAYGYQPSPRNVLRIPRSRSREIAKLYFVGQWVIGGGFSPAIMSGGICAEEIEKRRVKR
jgi:phytoene dehydrogenase-like protein